MNETTVLVSSLQLSQQARRMLRDADLEISFVPEPAGEDATLAELVAATH